MALQYRNTLEAQTSEWTLPESFGDCRVIVAGREDTEFVLYEFR